MMGLKVGAGKELTGTLAGRLVHPCLGGRKAYSFTRLLVLSF